MNSFDRAINIIVLEDNEQDLELILIELGKADFKFNYRHCFKKSSFEKNLILFKPDIILSDHNLNHFSETDALIISRRHDPDIPFILISGHIEEEAVDFIVQKKANDYVLKDNLNRLNPVIHREVHNYFLKKDLDFKNEELKKLSLVASHMNNGVVITDNKGSIEWVNKAYTNITGYSLKECFGKKPGNLLQGMDTDPKTVKLISKKLKSKCPFSVEILNYSKSNAKYWIKLDVSPIFDTHGTLKNFIAIQENITERKVSEIKLTESNKRLEQAQRIGGIGDWDYNVVTGEMEWSEQVFKIYDRDVSLGSPTFKQLREYHKDDVKTNTIITRAFKKGLPYEVDTTLKTRSGEEKFIRTIGIPVKSKSNITTNFTGIVQDITSRKKVENDLLSNQEKLKSITDNLPGVVFRYKLYHDGKDEVEFISEAVESIFEVPHQDALDNLNCIWSLIIEEDKEEMFDSISKSSTQMSIWDCTYRVKTKSGKLKWLHAVGVPKSKTEEYTIWDTLALEVTNEKELEISIKESNNRLLEAQSIANIGDWNIDFISGKTIVSPTIKEIHEVEPKFEFDLEKGLNFFKEGYDRERKRFVVNRAVEKGIPYNEELQIVTAKGNLRWVRSRGQAIHKKGVCVRLYGTFMDITEEKNLQLSLSQNEERLTAAVNGADLGIWDVNLKNQTNYVNEQYLEMLGYSLDSVNYDQDFFASILHPEDLYLPFKEIERIENGGENNIELVLRLKHKDGSYRRILDRGTVVEFDENRKVIRMVGTHLDVTETLELQENLQHSLEEKVVLLSEIHHRVKNNLAIISGLMELQSFETDQKIVKEILSEMAKRIKSIAGVHELLYSSKDFSSISFKRYIDNLFNELSSFISNDDKFKTEIDINENLQVNINQAVPLGLLLNELVTNSYKYAFDSKNSTLVKFSIELKKGAYEAHYSDNGPGFLLTEFTKPKKLGFTLINTLLAQLGARFSVKTEGEFQLTFVFDPKFFGSQSNI